MSRAIKGHVEHRGGRWQVQATDASGERAWHDLPSTITPEQGNLAQAVGTAFARKLRTGLYVPSVRDETVTEWFGRWFTHREARGWTDAKKLLGQFRKHVEPEIGHLPMVAVKREHVKALVSKLDALVIADSMSWKTAINLWSQLVSKPFKDATNGKEAGLCILEENPTAGVQGPDKGARTKKQYLYPDEATALLACEDVPLWRRRVYAFAVYTYLRAGEIAALRWDDVDVERGIIIVHQSIDRSQKDAVASATKTDEERRVTIELALRPMLRAMRDEATSELVFPKLPPYNGCDGQAATLRLDLERAQVKRPALLKRARTRKRMTFHDLRATGITWAAIRGDDALKIMSRSGHSEYQTLLSYIREAEVIREGFGETFPALPADLVAVERIAQESPKSPRNTPKTSIKQRPQGDSNPC